MGSNGRRSLLVRYEAGGSVVSRWRYKQFVGSGGSYRRKQRRRGTHRLGRRSSKAPDVSLGKNLASSGTLRIGSGGAAGALDVAGFGEVKAGLFSITPAHTFGARLEGGDGRRSSCAMKTGRRALQRQFPVPQ